MKFVKNGNPNSWKSSKSHNIVCISWFRQKILFQNIQNLKILNYVWAFFTRVYIYIYIVSLVSTTLDPPSRRSIVNIWDATDRQRKTPATFYLFFHLTPWECLISSSTPLNPRVVQWEKSFNGESFSFFPFFTLFYVLFFYATTFFFNVTCSKKVFYFFFK